MRKFVLGTATVLSLLAGCSRSHVVTSSNGSTVVVDKGKDGESAIHMTGKDGASVDINSGKPITGYPSDAPLYEGKSMMDVKSDEKHARQVMVQTTDPMDKVSEFYKTELPGKGWKVETSMNTDKMVMYVASKNARTLVVTIGSENGKQSISQTLADK